MLEPLLARHRSFWVLDLVRSPQRLGRGRRYNLLLSRWLVESLDDALGIFGPRIQSSSLDWKQSFLRRVPLLIRPGIVLVFVSLGRLLVSKPPRYVLSTADRRRQMDLRLLRHHGVRSLASIGRILALPFELLGATLLQLRPIRDWLLGGSVLGADPMTWRLRSILLSPTLFIAQHFE